MRETMGKQRTVVTRPRRGGMNLMVYKSTKEIEIGKVENESAIERDLRKREMERLRKRTRRNESRDGELTGRC